MPKLSNYYSVLVDGVSYFSGSRSTCLDVYESISRLLNDIAEPGSHTVCVSFVPAPKGGDKHV